MAMATIAEGNGKYLYAVLGGADQKNSWNSGQQLISRSLDVGLHYQKNSAEGSSSASAPTTITAGDTVTIDAGVISMS